MWKFLYNNFKYIIIIMFGLYLFFGIRSCAKAEFMDFIDNPWFLDPYQYREVYNSNGTNNRNYTSNNWGIYQSGGGLVHKVGAIVQNPPMIMDNSNTSAQDYFLQAGRVYIVVLNYNTGDSALRSQSLLLEAYGSYKNVNMKLKYLSSNGGYGYVTITKDNLAYYSITRISEHDLRFAWLVTLPEEPTDMNSEFMTLDIWISELSGCHYSNNSNACGMNYLADDGERKAGINLFQISYATAPLINDYLTTINDFNSQAFESETTTFLNETLDAVTNSNNSLANLNAYLHSLDNPNLSTLTGASNWLPAGPVDSILTLPLNLINSLTNSLSNNSCSEISVNLPFVNKTIKLPCINTLFGQIGFLTFWNWAGVIASAFIVYYYLKNLYKWVDNTLTFRENTQADWGGI